MEEIVLRYHEALVKRIDNLESAGAVLMAGETGAIDTIRQIAHQLMGSGGTYGYPEITAAAEALHDARENDFPERLNELLVILRKIVFEGRD